MAWSARFASLIVVVAAAGGCTSVSSNYNDDIADVSNGRLTVCHGFDCRNQTTLTFSADEQQRLGALFAKSLDAAAERQSIAEAVQIFENATTSRLGVADKPKSDLSQTGQHGQMDCIDESTNTRTFLRYLQSSGLVKHHEVQTNVTRGVLFDGRYFHATAVIRDKGGQRWAVDSWYEPAGGAPDVMRLQEWLGRGTLGRR
ncbi:hypothetical protein [Aliihoeflea sp. 40Bstr573]|uniref:hypothetical protein n=1 Tax=Aliihoeflea sp. 40Bstr573 TaxID=2696467 RepID=UPI002094FA6A|nr:hypothetical protein [Aliihoeflea sp. 40Bstr573]